MEWLALFDKDGNVTPDTIRRDCKKEIPKGRYFKVVLVFIQNHKGEFLIQKVSKEKGHIYATTSGHVSYQNTALETVKKEVLEELGIIIQDEEIIHFETENRTIALQESYYIKKDIDIKALSLQNSEVESACFLKKEEILKLIALGQFRKGNIYPFYDLLDLLEHGFSNIPLFFYRNRPFKKKQNL